MARFSGKPAPVAKITPTQSLKPVSRYIPREQRAHGETVVRRPKLKSVGLIKKDRPLKMREIAARDEHGKV